MWEMNEPGVNERQQRTKAMEMEKDRRIEWKKKLYFLTPSLNIVRVDVYRSFAIVYFLISDVIAVRFFKVNAFSH